ncbi:IS200/IS605 family transposase [Kitasatospora sp. GP30]|uniref:IS200/IS605 family transposase n=1 Tax=Kitasatospora sp. GP30 TaxID=3035084 RepID=UPI000C713399|nr:IS200/IS605 family transposase [Kitasatospora sp. GP30]
MRHAGIGENHAPLLHAHLAFVTGYPHRAFTDAHLTRMEEITPNVCADFERNRVDFNIEAGHVHLLVSLPPKVAVSKLVNSGKGVNSRRLQQGAPPGQRLGETSPSWSSRHPPGAKTGTAATLHDSYQRQLGRSAPPCANTGRSRRPATRQGSPSAPRRGVRPGAHATGCGHRPRTTRHPQRGRSAPRFGTSGSRSARAGPPGAAT